MESTRAKLGETLQYLDECFGKMQTLQQDAKETETAASRLDDPTQVQAAEATLQRLRKVYPISATAADERASKVFEKHSGKIAEDRVKLREREKEAAKGIQGKRISQEDIFESLKLIQKQPSSSSVQSSLALRRRVQSSDWSPQSPFHSVPISPWRPGGLRSLSSWCPSMARTS